MSDTLYYELKEQMYRNYGLAPKHRLTYQKLIGGEARWVDKWGDLFRGKKRIVDNRVTSLVEHGMPWRAWDE